MGKYTIRQLGLGLISFLLILCAACGVRDRGMEDGQEARKLKTRAYYQSACMVAVDAMATSRNIAMVAGCSSYTPSAAPGGPSNLSVEYRSLPTNLMFVQWQDNSSNETRFEISRCEGEGCIPPEESVHDTSANAESWNDQTAELQLDHYYRYKVRACNGTNPSTDCSAWSGLAGDWYGEPPHPIIVLNPNSQTATCALSEQGAVDLAVGNEGGAELEYFVLPGVSWLHVTDASDNPLSGGRVSAGSSQDVRIHYDCDVLGEHTESVIFTGEADVVPQDFTLNLTVLEGPEIGLSPSSLAPSCLMGGSTTAYVDISNIGLGTLDWEATALPSWVTDVSPLEGIRTADDPATTVELQITCAELGEGTYTSFMTFVGQPGVDSVTLPIELTVNLIPGPEITLIPGKTLNLSCDVGNETSGTLEIQNTGGVILNWSATISPASTWITNVSAADYSLDPGQIETVTVSVDCDGLSSHAGPYVGTVVFSGQTGVDPVTLDVGLIVQSIGPVMVLNPSSFYEYCQEGQADLVAYMTVTNEGDEVLNWSAEWFNFSNPLDDVVRFISPSGGTLTPGSSETVGVHYTCAGLGQGGFFGGCNNEHMDFFGMGADGEWSTVIFKVCVSDGF